MPFPIPPLDDMHAILIAFHKRHFPDIDISPMSDDWLWTRTIAGAVTDNHAHTDATETDLLPDTSAGGMLDRWGKIVGVPRKPATGARKEGALRVTGTVGVEVPDGSQLVHISQLLFKVEGTFVIGADGFVDVDVAAISTGSATRLAAGETLSFVEEILDVFEEAALVKALDEDGTDQEKDGAYRLRILSRFSSPPLGGAAVDYVQWALEVTGIAAAYCYPLRRGLGTVDLTALHEGSGSARILDQAEVDLLQALLDVKRPVSVKGFRVLLVEDEDNNVVFEYVPNGEQQFEPDFDDSIPVEVNAYNAGTRLVTLDADRPLTMKAGDRIIVSNGATGAERVIESLHVDDDKFTLEPDADGDVPDATSTLYAGGPLCEPIRQAIKALTDGLGTANPDSKRYGSWEGNLRPTAIGRVATAVDGVLDGDVLTPAATVEAADPRYPDDEPIGLITPGRIIARRKH